LVLRTGADTGRDTLFLSGIGGIDDAERGCCSGSRAAAVAIYSKHTLRGHLVRSSSKSSTASWCVHTMAFTCRNFDGSANMFFGSEYVLKARSRILHPVGLLYQRVARTVELYPPRSQAVRRTRTAPGSRLGCSAKVQRQCELSSFSKPYIAKALPTSIVLVVVCCSCWSLLLVVLSSSILLFRDCSYCSGVAEQ
jgi:hypothetical protein